MEMVSNPVVEVFETSIKFYCQKVCIELGKTNLVTRTRGDFFIPLFFSKTRAFSVRVQAGE